MTHRKHSIRTAGPNRAVRIERRTPTWRQLVALTAVMGIVAVACGRSEDTTSDGAKGDDAATTTQSSSAGGLAAGEFGDLGQVCGPAQEGATLEATDVGVTSDSIQVGTISDPGFAGRPGLNQEIFDSAEAFSKWCNEAGGINGRKIDLRERDAKMTEHQARMIDACDEGDFMLVGGLGVFDDQGQQERLACGLPSISSATNPALVEADLIIAPLSNDTSTLPIGDLRWLDKQFPEATGEIGIMTAAYPVTITASARAKEAIASLGWKVVYDEQYNPAGEASWRGFVEGMKAAGVRGFIWTADPVNLAAVLKEMNEIEFHPDFIRVASNIYDSLFLSEAGAAADNTYITGSSYPFLDPALAKQNPATQQYLDIMHEYDPAGKIANLGVTGFSAWLLFAKAATECGADVTRDCVWEHAKQFTEWTGGGLQARQDLATDRVSECFVEIAVKDGKWTLPDAGANEGVFNCDPANVLEMHGDYGQGVKCENPAFASDPKPSNCAP